MLDNIYQINGKHTHTQQVKDSMSKHNKNYRKNELKIRRMETVPACEPTSVKARPSTVY